ncbi:MAG: hypothetical protein OXG60_02495 [Chloroflexi bacterium]|nr:hypothetical protein [Chloroflexota bacterium]
MSIKSRLFCLFALLGTLTACQGQVVTERVIIVTATPDSRATATFEAAKAATEAVPTATPTQSPTPDPFPTPVIGAIYVAEQRFERGWMLWLQPNQQIWLLTVNDSDEHLWSVYDDDFVDGDIESDPEIVAPEGKQQPIRGFGKLWRENLEVRTAIGWALEDELGHTTRYEYHHGGALGADNQYIAGPGYHLVESLYGDTFRFNEVDSTWQIVE